MTLNPSEVGVVVVTFKRPEALKKTLVAILSQGVPESQVVIINNDPLVYLSPKEIGSSYTQITILNQLENIASAGGFALGMEFIADKGLKWAWLFNDDSRPVTGSFDFLARSIQNLPNNKIGLVKIANFNTQGKAILLNWKGVRVPSYVEPSEELVPTDLVTFDGCLISTNLIRSVGTCDPAYFMGTYEFDYCLRAKDAGYGIYTLPNGMIEDEKAGSQGGTPPWRQYYNTRNHLHLGIFRRDFQIVSAWIVREMKFTYAILRFEDRKIERLRMKLTATIHALKGKRGKVYSSEKT